MCIKGVICDIRVEDIEEPLMQVIRYLDKLIDELAKVEIFRKDKIQGAEQATSVHYNVGKELRTAIEKIGATMPEDLPIHEKSIQ